MSLLIKGMDMPKKAYKDINGTLWSNGSNGRFTLTKLNNIMSDYEVIEVPTPHGRLIDADALKKQIAATYYSQDEKNKAPMDDIPWMNGCNTKVKEVCGMIDDASTIIEAEEGQE